MSEKKNHQVNIVRLGEPRVHTNADSLELFDIGAYQVVTKKGNFKAGDCGVYIQPDSVVPQTEPFSFIWEPYATEHMAQDGVVIHGDYDSVPEKRRRITVRKFRGEWSEGLLLPLSEFPELVSVGIVLSVGTDISELLGITHYDPDKGKESAADVETFKRKRKGPHTLKGWFFFLLHKLTGKSFAKGSYSDNEDGTDMPVFDVDALKHYKDAFDPEEIVEVTEKIHGSNARFVFRDEHMFAGSRTQWKAEGANCIWRNVLRVQPWIEEWCRAHPGYGLYGEVTPTQGEKFQYGSAEPQLFVFDIRTPEGTWMSREEVQTMFVHEWVPVFYIGPYKNIPWELVDGQTTVPGAKGIREGFVIRPVVERHVRGLGRLILKVVSNAYLSKETS